MTRAERRALVGRRERAARAGVRTTGARVGRLRFERLARWAAPLGLAVLSASAGCGAGAQKNAVEAAMSSDQERATAFEATARALDEHPQYVDEFYAVARRHDPLMRRFIQNTTRDLRDPQLAGTTAGYLVQSPPSLEQTLVSTIDAARPVPAARTSVGRAVVERSDALADIVSDDPQAVRKANDSIAAAVQQRAAARAAFLAAMRDSAPRLTEMLKNDPETMKVLFGALLRNEDQRTADEFLRRLGVTK